jgi:hypothetical protein
MEDSMAEVVMWQYRWLNPGDMPDQQESMLEWKPVEHPRWQPLEAKLQELRDYRYGGKPCYEVRALGVIDAPGVKENGNAQP